MYVFWGVVQIKAAFIMLIVGDWGWRRGGGGGGGGWRSGRDVSGWLMGG